MAYHYSSWKTMIDHRNHRLVKIWWKDHQNSKYPYKTTSNHWVFRNRLCSFWIIHESSKGFMNNQISLFNCRKSPMCTTERIILSFCQVDQAWWRIQRCKSAPMNQHRSVSSERASAPRSSRTSSAPSRTCASTWASTVSVTQAP